MLKYSDLTKAQKRFIDAVVREFPAVAKAGQVSRKELESIYWTLNEKRAAGGEKVGFPNWLTAKNKVGRGVFALPLAGATGNSTAKKAVAAEKSKFEKIIEESLVEDDSFDEDVEAIKQELVSAK
jgi:hypothetical protein